MGQGFLDNLTKDPKKLAQMPHLEYMREAGAEGIEMVMWLVMRGALDDKVDEVYRFYTVPASNTAVGHIILANRPRAAKRRRRAQACRRSTQARGRPTQARRGAGESSADSELTQYRHGRACPGHPRLWLRSVRRGCPAKAGHDATEKLRGQQ